MGFWDHQKKPSSSPYFSEILKCSHTRVYPEGLVQGEGNTSTQTRDIRLYNNLFLQANYRYILPTHETGKIGRLAVQG